MKKGVTISIIAVLAVLAIALGAIHFTNNAEKIKQIDALNAEVADKAGQIESLNADVADKAGQIETLNADVADKAGQIETLSADVADKAGQIEALSADVADKASRIDTLNADVNEKAGQIESLNADAAGKAEEIETLHATIQEKENQIETLTADVTEKAGRIETLTADIADRESRIETLNGEAEENQKSISLLKSIAAGKMEKIDALNGTIDTMKAEAGELNAEIRKLDAEKKEKDEQMISLKKDIKAIILKYARGKDGKQPAQDAKLLSLLTIPKQENNEQTEGKAEEEQETQDKAILLATVNGEEIDTGNDYLNKVITYYLNYVAQSGYDATSPDILDTIHRYSMKYTIRSVVMKQKARELGIGDITYEDKVDMEMKAVSDWLDILDRIASESGAVSADATEEEKAEARANAAATILETSQYDEERYVQESMESDTEMLIQDRVVNYLTEGKTVTDEDVQKYFDDLVSKDEETYKDNIAMYEYYTNYYGQSSHYVPEGYRAVTHILLKVDEELLNNWKDLTKRLEEQEKAAEAAPAEAEPAAESEAAAEPAEEPAATPEPVTKEMVEAAEKAILDSVQPIVDEINAKLEAGASFEDLIMEYGTDPGMQDDSTRASGYLVHQDSILWDPVFTAAAMGLEKVGDVSQPVVSQFGVHILNYLKDIPGGAIELTDEMKEEFRTTLLKEMWDEALSTAIDQWAGEADIVYTEDGESWKPADEAE